MKSWHLQLGDGMSASCYRGGPHGRYFVGHRKGASALFQTTDELRKFLKLPAGTTSRTVFDGWAAELEAEPSTDKEASDESPD